jgi:hypothetical protein
LRTAGQSWLCLLFVGDTDETRETKNAAPVTGEFDQSRRSIGSLVLTVVSIAAPEVARPVRYLSVPLGAVWMAAPFMFGANMVTTVVWSWALRR